MAGTKHLDYKVPGGKMIRLDIAIDDGTVTSIRITGDFFMYPEEAVESIERFLTGKKISESLAAETDSFLKRKGIRLVGLAADDIAEAISMAAGR